MPRRHCILAGDMSTIGSGAEAWLNGNGHAVEQRFDQATAADLSVALADYEESLGATPGAVALLRGDLYQDALSAAASVDPTNTAPLSRGAARPHRGPRAPRGGPPPPPPPRVCRGPPPPSLRTPP